MIQFSGDLSTFLGSAFLLYMGIFLDAFNFQFLFKHNAAFATIFKSYVFILVKIGIGKHTAIHEEVVILYQIGKGAGNHFFK